MEDNTMHVQPGRSVGFMTLGSSLHEVLTTIKGDVRGFPRIHLTHDDERPIESPIHVGLPDNGLRLQFDGPDQRLRLIEVLDFSKVRLVYKDVEIYKPAVGQTAMKSGAPGPTFRHIYDKVLGPTYGGEYTAPRGNDPGMKGTYNLSYPGIAFNFPVRHDSYSPDKNVIALLSSSVTGPATSMAVFSGESWQKARATLFTAPPPYPRASSLLTKGREDVPEEIELARIHDEGKIEFIRRSSPPFWLVLNETTPQDLIMELGAPDSIYKKSDHRLSIHQKDRRSSDVSDNSAAGFRRDDPRHSEDSSGFGAEDRDDDDDDDDDWEDDDAIREREADSADHFYNYYTHGFDILISQPTHRTSDLSPPSASPPSESDKPSAIPLGHLTATKILFHGNVPGSYQFNRHRRSRWRIEICSAGLDREPLTSEMRFEEELAPRLKRAFRAFYESEEEEALLQRGMALNRGWGDSPGSSMELLTQWDGGLGGNRREGRKVGMSALAGGNGGFGVGVGVGEGGEAEVGNVELFGFPGLVFEVLRNGAINVSSPRSTYSTDRGVELDAFNLQCQKPNSLSARYSQLDVSISSRQVKLSGEEVRKGEESP
ncbi:uncharacterized protein EI97DRAFT_474620 [Westerdykella ornata]|uniref:Uncharacterized protein n=1 Tax=Westerdykella ornata TaxID=318751 RepID=A0A6A6JH12_WESOR|nr:uncharacterized protein EI97DRAFT_474620 [Westerdykella ornata]KAF2275950.1 hypothetical protein EI97DRAFT_474620 [Westerdykella ornata]